MEVLVAGFILFLAVSIASTVYSAALKSKANATRSIQISSYVPLIRDDIKVQLRNENGGITQGNGQFLGVRYRWQANRKDSKSMFKSAEEMLSEKSTGNRQVTLWNVTLTVELGTYSEAFTFSATGWGQ